MASSRPPSVAASPTRPVVLVTGAARRVGRAIALELAAHGFDLALHYRRSHDEAEATAAEVRALGARAHCFAADLGDEAACRNLVPAVVQQLPVRWPPARPPAPATEGSPRHGRPSDEQW